MIVGLQGYGKSVWAKKFTEKNKRLIVFDPMRSYPSVDFDYNFDDWESLLKSGSKFRIGTDNPEIFPSFGALAYGVGGCTVVIEECAVFFPRGKNLLPWTNRLVYMGRHQRVNLLCIAQRASSIPIQLRSQALRLVSFNQQERDDVLSVCARIGNKYRDTLQRLEVLQCLDHEEGHVKNYHLSLNGEREQPEKDEEVDAEKERSQVKETEEFEDEEDAEED